MAARKKTTAKRTAAPAKKGAPKATPARRAVAAKPAAAAPKPIAAAKPVAAAAKPVRKAAAPKKEVSATSAVEALAKRIVKLTTTEPGSLHIEELYAPDCVSCEPRAEPVVGLEGLEAKGKVWGQMQKRSSWTPLNVVTTGNTIFIEWSAEVELRDGRTVTLREVAVHNTKGGKIVEERYYYDPIIFESTAQVEAAPEAPAPRARRAAPPPPVENLGTPSIDPIDL